jgi:hypothetical protein
MAMTTLRPDLLVTAGAWLPVGTGSIVTALSDNSDSTYAQFAFETPGNTYMETYMGDFSFPALSIITAVVIRARFQLKTGSPHNNGFDILYAIGGGAQDVILSATSVPATPTNYASASDTTPPGGGSWDSAKVQAIQIGISPGSGTYSAGDGLNLYELYADVYYDVVPLAPVVTVPVASREDVTVSWVFSDPDLDTQDAMWVKLFTSAVVNGGGFDPETSATVYSNSTASSASSEVCDANLPDGRYYAYVKTRGTNNGNYGPWGGSSEFRIVNDPVMMI